MSSNQKITSNKSPVSIGVIGIGGMGPAISLGFARAGYTVKGIDIDETAIRNARREVDRSLVQLVGGGLLSQSESQAVRGRIDFTIEWEKSVAASDFVVESVPEVLAIKRDVFKRCDEILPPEVVIASNTSSMSITQIAEGMKFPERAIISHWTIPAHLLRTVEIVRGEKTSQETFDRTYSIYKKIGKNPVECQDHPGFIHNYIQFAMVQAALELVEDGIATAEDIDTVIKNGFGLRLSSVGPIEFIDMCGLDTILNVQKYMYEKTGKSNYAPSKLIGAKVKAGDLGVKTGKGFYDYGKADGEDFWNRANRDIMAILKSTGNGTD
jgi:3-hydroxybutyryl-CoA dehydrogenase